MLGIDIADNSIKIVSMKRRGRRFVLDQLLELPFSPEQSTEPVLLGQMLGDALREKGLHTQPAVMTLPHRLSFIKRYTNADLDLPKGRPHLSRSLVEKVINLSRQSLSGLSDELTFDLWYGQSGSKPDQKGEDTILVGTVRNAVVNFCKEMAVAGGLQLQALELRSMASINGLLLNWKNEAHDTIAVAYCESNRAYVAIIDLVGLVSLQTLTLGTGNWLDSLGEQLPRVFNTLKLHHGRPSPQLLYLSSQQELGEAELAGMQQKLGIAVTPRQHQAALRFSGECAVVPNKIDYTPAIGAALEGLSASAAWFDFLHPHAPHAERKKISWTPLIAAAITLIVVGGGLWLSILDQKLEQLSQNREQIAQLEPELSQIMASAKSWQLFRSFLPLDTEGARIEYLRILFAINQLMPDTREAFITNLTILHSVPAGVDGKQIVITLRASQADVGTKLIDDLNQSVMFQDAAQIGPRTRDENDTLYPLSFVVGCNFKPDWSTP